MLCDCAYLMPLLVFQAPKICVYMWGQVVSHCAGSGEDGEKRLLLSAALWAQMFPSASAESLSTDYASWPWLFKVSHYTKTKIRLLSIRLDWPAWNIVLFHCCCQWWEWWGDWGEGRGVNRLADCQEEWRQREIWFAVLQEGWDQHGGDGLTHLLLFYLLNFLSYHV